MQTARWGQNQDVDADIRYARSGGVAIAYQVVGQGDTDLVYVPAYMSNLVYEWEHPRMRQSYERLARSFRLIRFDKRGTGLSDHGSMFASLETRMEDLRAVLDAAGSSHAVVFGSFEGAGLAILFAATYPERVRSLVLLQPVSHAGGSTEERATILADMRERWGTQEYADELLRDGARR